MLGTAIDTLRAYLWWARVSLTVFGRRGARLPKRDRHLLLLAWALPPTVSGGVFRPLSFLRYSGNNGWTVTGIGGDTPERVSDGAREHLDSLPATVDLAYISAPPLKPSWRAFPQVNGGFLEALETFDRVRNKLSDKRPTAILASGPPFHNFVAALWISRYFKIPFMLDYRDEWTESPFEFVSLGTVDRKWESKCLAAADRVIFTTESQRSHALETFEELSPDRTIVIPNGWEPADAVTASCSENQPSPDDPSLDNLRVISFIGNLGDHTPPHAFLDTIAKVIEKRMDLRANFRLRFVGRRSVAAEAALAAFPYPEMLEIRDLVPKSEAISLMQQSSALVLFALPDLERYIPGKLYDYISCGNPVLIFGHRGEASAVVEKINAGKRIADGDVDGLAAFVDALNCANTAVGLPSNASKWLEDHTRERSAYRMFGMVDQLRD